MNYEEALIAMLQGKPVKIVGDTRDYYYIYDMETKTFERLTPRGPSNWEFTIESLSNAIFELYSPPVYEYQFLFRPRDSKDPYSITIHMTRVEETNEDYEYEVVLSSKRLVCA